ncbi:hypothetical protein [Bartonella sp. C271]|uniref:hypothetical protein n=1 Tax=Bartonella sp. C271 TaxID=3070220 RepID=UPI0038B5D73B
MKIKKILLSLILTILMIGSSISGSYAQEGYIDEVSINAETSRCSLRVKYTSSPSMGFGMWNCNSIAGKAILDLAKIAAMLNRPVEVTLEDSPNLFKELLYLTLK